MILEAPGVTSGVEEGERGEEFGRFCCRSCRFEVLGEELADGRIRGRVHEMLPRGMMVRAGMATPGVVGVEDRVAARRRWAR